MDADDVIGSIADMGTMTDLVFAGCLVKQTGLTRNRGDRQADPVRSGIIKRLGAVKEAVGAETDILLQNWTFRVGRHAGSRGRCD